MRKIIHIDMDAFFAAIEQHDHPELRGKPVIVGGKPENRGVVCTASYEARVFGVHSAQPAVTARRLCPHGVFLEPNAERYREVSHTIRKIFHSVTDLVEPLSIDEAFLDVTEQSLRSGYSATRIARMIQRKIFAVTGLTGSAGVSYNKFLAKIASDLKKPCGLSVIPPEAAAAFLEQLPVRKFYGIGPATAERLNRMGIRTGKDLKALDLELLRMNFGKVGEFYYQIVRGIDPRQVEVNTERKSLGREVTFAKDISGEQQLFIQVHELADEVFRELAEHNLAGRTVTLKVRYEDFQTVTRSLSLPAAPTSDEELKRIALELLVRTEALQRPVRLLGLSCSGFHSRPEPKPQAEQLLLPFPENIQESIARP